MWVTVEVGEVELPGAYRRSSTADRLWFDTAHTGTEHVVAIVGDVDAIDAVVVGRIIRHHPDLAPLGTNVNFVQPPATRS